EALAEAQPGAVRPLRLEHDGTGETRAEHDVVVALARSHVLHQLVRLAAPPEGERIDHLAQQPVAVRIARPHDLDVEHRGCVLPPQVVALEERPEAGRRGGEIDGELVLAHAGSGYNRDGACRTNPTGRASRSSSCDTCAATWGRLRSTMPSRRRASWAASTTSSTGSACGVRRAISPGVSSCGSTGPIPIPDRRASRDRCRRCWRGEALRPRRCCWSGVRGTGSAERSWSCRGYPAVSWSTPCEVRPRFAWRRRSPAPSSPCMPSIPSPC